MKINIPEHTHIIFDSLNNNCRLVGGCVRDAVMNRNPKDWDFCTPLLPEQVTELLKGKVDTVFDMSNGHGTITAIHNDISYEITTLRVDDECDGRHAKVSYTTDYQQDAQRRDFTFNAMSADREGNVYDYFNGIQDINNNEVKFVGTPEHRIREDYLRILRAFRFAVRYNFKLPEILHYRLSNEFVEGLQNISGERVWSEVKQIISHENFYNNTSYGLAMRWTRTNEAIGWKYDCSVVDHRFWCNDALISLALTLKIQPETTSDDVEYIKTKWRLSNVESKKIEDVFNIVQIVHENETLPARDINEILVNYYEYDKQFLDLISKTPPLKMLEPELNNTKKRAFKVNGYDLMNEGFRGKQIGIEMKRRKMIHARTFKR